MEQTNASPSRVDTKPLNKLAMKALTHLHRTVVAEEQEIINEAAKLDGIQPEDGWGLDLQRGMWVRHVPVTE